MHHMNNFNRERKYIKKGGNDLTFSKDDNCGLGNNFLIIPWIFLQNQITFKIIQDDHVCVCIMILKDISFYDDISVVSLFVSIVYVWPWYSIIHTIDFFIPNSVKCRSCRPLPVSVWVFDETADITVALLCCGLEHSEKHQDGNNNTRLAVCLC